MIFPLEQQAEIRPDATALVWQQREYTFSKLHDIVESHASFLKKNIRRTLPRVGILGDNSDRWIIALLAGWRCGFCIVPFSPRWSDIEIAEAINNSEIDVVIVSEKYESRIPESISHAKMLLDETFAGERHEENRLQSYFQYAPNEPALILYTSGTSGASKQVLLSWQSLLNHAQMSAEHLGYTSDDSWLVTLPLSHIGGLSTILKSLVTGIKIIVDRKFDTIQTSYLIEKTEPTFTSLVPTMLSRLLELGNGKLNDCFKNILIGGGPISDELILSDERLLATYGMSEAGSQIATVPPGSTLEVRKTAGKTLPGVEIEIRNENQEVVTENVIGSIWVKSPALAIGYSSKEQTSQTFIDGWLDTGDFGVIRDEGCLKIEMRRVDRIVTGGENVNPLEVEVVLKNHPSIKDASVFGKPSETWGQSVKAVVVFNEKKDMSFAEFKSYLSDKLAVYKIPKEWMVIDSMPLLANGKLDKQQLIEKFSNNIS
jgi:o-succinylbenzoate---CoA ligase